MTPVVLSAASAPAALTQSLPVTLAASSSADLDRLRTLVAGVQPTGENVQVGLTPPPGKIEESGFRTLGDSILEGVAKFNSGYNDSLSNITTKLEHISANDPLQLGNNFGELMSLQVEVARWTMSVMGVDNASKAGTNTIKELSKGG
ncbi:hypothetical protein GCM10023213_47860 [Prosthecobacter algae]|uniref:Uncharacterized protein n=1 Tax=Prosthecobacter algae TaxID=1144682 RepID=A0ABP9PS44_9BACT